MCLAALTGGPYLGCLRHTSKWRAPLAPRTPFSLALLRYIQGTPRTPLGKNAGAPRPIRRPSAPSRAAGRGIETRPRAQHRSSPTMPTLYPAQHQSSCLAAYRTSPRLTPRMQQANPSMLYLLPLLFCTARPTPQADRERHCDTRAAGPSSHLLDQTYLTSRPRRTRPEYGRGSQSQAHQAGIRKGQPITGAPGRNTSTHLAP